MVEFGLRFIPPGTVDNNVGPDRLAHPKALTSQLLHLLNPLTARPLPRNHNCVWQWVVPIFYQGIPPTYIKY